MNILQLFSANYLFKMYDTSNFKNPLDKNLLKEYNDIVNSKGAADMGSVALFLVVALIPYTKGCMMY